MSDTLSIGIVAARTGLAVSAVRYYDEIGVIETAENGADLGPLAVAGEPKILLGEVDVNEDGLCRIWAVLDNLTRGGALNALELAKRILAR